MKRWMPIALLVVVGCDTSRVRWEQPQAAPGDTTGQIQVDLGGGLAYPVRDTVALLPNDSSMCPGSAVSVAVSNIQYSAWLHLRADSTVRVMAGRWQNDRWNKPVTVDSLDVAKIGCHRPAPSMTMSEDGSVHVAYSIQAPEGYGVFFGHSMDQAASFHDPMIVVYGDRLSATAIATYGPRVAIAYEDPSGSVRRIGLALSNTQGHTFEPREVASPDEMTAMHPRVAMMDTVVAISFAGLDTTQRAIRVGYLRK